jgi:hypothetical protein
MRDSKSSNEAQAAAGAEDDAKSYSKHALVLNSPVWTEDQDFFGSGLSTL